MIRLALAFLLFASLRSFGANGDITGAWVDRWSLFLPVSGMSTGGVYSLGFNAYSGNTHTNGELTGAEKVKLTVGSQGMAYNGSTNLNVRTVYGTRYVTALDTNGYPADEVLISGGVLLRIALSSFIHTNDTILACQILSGLYVQGGITSAANSSLSVTNTSVLPYTKVVAGWTYPNQRVVQSSNMVLRAVAFHKSAQNLLPVAGVEFKATDSAGNSFTQYVSKPTVDRGWYDDYYPTYTDVQGFGSANPLNDALQFGEYIATFPTNLMAAGLVKVNFRAYPFRGDSNSVYDTALSGFSAPTPVPSQATNAINFPRVYCVVSTNGNNTNGVVLTESQYASNHDPTPFLNASGAYIAIAATNGILYGRTNIGGGVIFYKEGTHSLLGATTTIAAGPDVGVVMMPHTNCLRENTILGAFATDSRGTDDKDIVRVYNMTINNSSANLWARNAHVWLDRCVILNAAAGFIQNAGGAGAAACNWYMTGCTVSNVSQGLKQNSGTQNAPLAILRGSEMVGNSGSHWFHTTVGNIWKTNSSGVSSGTIINNQGVVTNEAPYWGGILYNNKIFRRMSGVELSTGDFVAITNGLAVIQNLFENCTNDTGSTGFQIGSEDLPELSHTNIMFWHNTLVGTKQFFGYNDTTNQVAYRVDWSSYNNVLSDKNIKGWDFVGDGGVNTNRIGNLELMYGVDCWGDANLETTSIGAPGSFLGFYLGIESWGTATGSTSSSNYPAFYDYRAHDGVNTTQGNGDYRLKNTSILFQRNTVKPVLSYDIDGNPRGIGDPPGAFATGQASKGL